MKRLVLFLLFVSGFAYAQPAINTPSPYVVCDDNNDGVSCSFTLSTKDAEISTQPGIQIEYYLTLTDSQTGSNYIPKNSVYCNISGAYNQTIYVRVVDPADPNNPAFTTLSLVVNPAPNFTITNTSLCVNGLATISAVNNGTPGNYTYVWTIPSGATPTGNTSTFNTAVAGIYTVLITDATISCNTTLTTTVNSFPSPAPNFTITNTNICSGAPATITTVNNGISGNYTFWWTTPPGVPNPGNTSTFNTSDAGIYTVSITDATTTCNTTLTTTVNALANTAPTFSFPTTFCVGSMTALPETADNGIIGTWSPATLAVGTNTYTFTPYVGQCASIYSVSITILSSPIVNQPPNMMVTDNPYDGVAVFNLTSQNGLINTGASLYTFRYYTSLFDAQSGTNQIVTPTAYTNISNPQNIYVSVTDPLTISCPSITSFQLIVNDPNNVNIPDANFKAKLITLGVDINSDGNIQYSEAQAVTTAVDVTGSNISDITGFEAFVNVPSFDCRNNNISTINLSNLPNLKSFECGFNSNLTSLNLTNLSALDSLKTFNTNLSSLNVNNLTSLKHLDCSYNHISSLNLSNLTQLKVLNCASNALTTLNVTPLTQLEELNCSMNQLGTITVTPLVHLKTLICSNNGINTLNLSNLPSLEHLEYGNNQSTSFTFSNLPNMKYLDCSGNSLTALNATSFPLLEYLNCGGNNLTSLVVTGLTHLGYIACSVNQLPTLNLNGLSSLNYLNCLSNQLTALNLSGLNNLMQVYASNNSISSITATNLPNLSLAYFDNNQLTSLDVSGSTHLQNLAVYTNHLNSITLTGLVLLSYLDCHENQLTSINFSGLTALQTVLCDHNNLTSLDFSGNPVFQNLSCTFNVLTSINIKNGYPYINTNNFWHENPNLTYVCCDTEEIQYVQTILNQSNLNNVVFNTYCSFTPGGTYNTITGTIRYDSNNNGCDGQDPVFPNIRVDMQQWGTNNATMSNSNGVYTFYTTFADQSLSLNLENPSYFNVSPQNPTVSFNETNFLTANQDFCLSPNGNHMDLDVTIQPLTVARPGFDATYRLVYRNKGNMLPGFNSGVRFEYNPNQMSYVSASQTVGTQGSNYIVFDYSNLMPFETRTITVTFHVNAPTDSNPVVIGNILHLHANVGLNIGDVAPADNDFYYDQMVVGAYDPNIITCMEGETLPTTEIGKYLHYGITFENTGNYQAENVVVKDVIDTTKYDINTLQLLNASHPVYTRISGNAIEFIFKNINLAAADGNPPVGGHGDILFKIKSLSNLGNGDVVTKSAKIFFDYNAPIDTNTAETTYQNLSNSIHQLDSSISVYPNPTNSFVTITCKSTIKSIELYDVQGRLLETSIENSNSSKLDISTKQNGIYFLKINSDNGSKVEKIVKE